MRSSWKLATTATVVLFLGAKPCQAQEKVDKADTIIRKLSEVSQDLLEWKKENEARLKKAETEVAQLRQEVAELKKCVQEMKKEAQAVKEAKIEPVPQEQEVPKLPVVHKSQVQEKPKKQPPVVVETQKPGTFQIVNTWGNAQVVVNGVLYKVPLGTTNIPVKPGTITYRTLEVPGEKVYEIAVGSGETWQYKIYPDERPPTVPLYTYRDSPPTVPLYVPYQGYQPTVYYNNCQPVYRNNQCRILPRLFRK